MQHTTATPYNTLHHSTAHCNTLQQSTTHCNIQCNTLLQQPITTYLPTYSLQPYAPTNNPTLHAYPYTPTRYQIYTKSTYQPYKGPYTLNTDPAPTYLPYTPTNPTTCLHACHASDSQHHYLSAAPATLACYCAVHLRSTSHGILFAAKFMGETIALEFD